MYEKVKKMDIENLIIVALKKKNWRPEFSIYLWFAGKEKFY